MRSPCFRPDSTGNSPRRGSRSPNLTATLLIFLPSTRQTDAASPTRTSALSGSISACWVPLSMRPSANRPDMRGALLRSSKATVTATCRVVALAAMSTRLTVPLKSPCGTPLTLKVTGWPVLISGMRSAETRPSKRRLLGSMTLSSSLPMAAVSPAETLRSLTTPSKGARTSVRRSCWRAVTTRDVAATLSLRALLRRTSASSSACAEVMPWACSVRSRCTERSDWSSACAAARADSSALVRLSRMAVSSRRTSSSPLFTASPLSR